MQKIVGGNIRRYRLLKQMSQKALAEESGIFRTYLSRIEAGKGNPSLTVLAALASVLGVQLHVLFIASNE